jgi:hypothetical protein
MDLDGPRGMGKGVLVTGLSCASDLHSVPSAAYPMGSTLISRSSMPTSTSTGNTSRLSSLGCARVASSHSTMSSDTVMS